MKELITKWVGRKGLIYFRELKIAVEVKDVKERWGNVRFLVSPEAGQGEIWVESLIEVSA